MVKRNYIGVQSPQDQFRALAPLREHVLRMQNQVRPFGPDYHVLEALKKALEIAAHHFTGDPTFYTHRPPGG